VDFDSEMVILSAAGPRADSCWDLAIDSVRAGSARIAVSAGEIRRTACACLAFDERSVPICP
jgi:hypothetical protein